MRFWAQKVSGMKIVKWIKTRLNQPTDRGDAVVWYPSHKGCVRKDMRQVRPSQLPPLMVRKPAWRKWLLLTAKGYFLYSPAAPTVTTGYFLRLFWVVCRQKYLVLTNFTSFCPNFADFWQLLLCLWLFWGEFCPVSASFVPKSTPKLPNFANFWRFLVSFWKRWNY